MTSLNPLREAMRAFPNCRVASCECDEHNGEWRPGCHCFGHFKEMDEAFPDGWDLADFSESAEVGKPKKKGVS